MTTNNTLTTKVTQAAVVVAKGAYVAVQMVNFNKSHKEQADPVQIDAFAKPGAEGETRINALVAVLNVIESVDYAYANFFSIYVPGAIVDRLEDKSPVRWMQMYKKANAAEVAKAESEGREPRKISSITVPTRIGKEKRNLKVTVDEIELWVELFMALGEKPFITLSNSRYASKAFKDRRATTLDLMIDQAYNFISELGAEIQQPETTEDTEQEITLNIGAGKRRASEAVEEDDAV